MSINNSNTISLTILVDNNSNDGLLNEHGFSIWIEAYGKRILFDTGQSDAFVYNADKLQIDIASADFLILSHGHYDHSGGLLSFLQQNSSGIILLHPAALKKRYSIKTHAYPKNISLPENAREVLSNLPQQRIQWIEQPTTIDRHIGVSGTIPRTLPFEDTDGAFYLDEQAKFPDKIEDDIALWIETPQGLVVITGCAHAGLINTLQYIQQITTQNHIYGCIGGFHLNNASSERIQATVSHLRLINPKLIISCHCTGDKAIQLLKTESLPVVSGYSGLRWLI